MLVEKVVALAAFLSIKTGNCNCTLRQRGASTLHSITTDIIHANIFPASLAINGNIGGISGISSTACSQNVHVYQVYQLQ
jgi:hypothetical protein